MQLDNKIAVVTGGASGIGRALARRFVAEGAAKVVVSDINAEGAQAVADEIGGLAVPGDVGVEADVVNLVERTEAEVGPIDLFCANAGIAIGGGLETPEADWEKCWAVNVMAHIYVARAVVPRMAARGGGYVMTTVSAAGLLSHVGSSTYSTTKHAAVGFAEWLSIAHGDDGIKVSILCPQAVRTAMTAGLDNGGVAGIDGMIEPEQLADTVIEALAEERFLVLPHPQVLGYMQHKTADYDRWLGGMRKLRRQFGDRG